MTPQRCAWMRRKLTACWERASADQRTRGLVWYDEAGRVAEDLARRGRVTKDQAAGIIAALSPQNYWHHNIRLAYEVVDGRRDGTFTASISKAIAIKHGKNPAIVLGGPKTLAFYANIAGNLEPVTLDRHMFKACGHKLAGCSPMQYAGMAEAVRSTAGAVGLEPAKFQAVIWLVIRERNRSISL